MKVLSKEDLLLLISNSPRPNWDENEIVQLFYTYGDDYFVEGINFMRFGTNEKMTELRNIVNEVKEYLS